MAAADHAGEQPLSCGPRTPPVLARGLQRARGEHDEAVVAALALLVTGHHAPTVDVGRSAADGLGDAQSLRIAGGRDDAVTEGVDRIEKGDDILGAGHHTGSFAVGRISGMFQPFCSVTPYRKRSATTATPIEAEARRFPVAR